LDVGRVYNSNAPMLSSALERLNCEPIYFGIVRDDPDLLKRAILTALEKADCVITTGGTSVGKGDFVPEVVKGIGKLVVHGISIKPGMPTGFGIVNGKPILILSGFPVACLIGFKLIFPEVLSKLLGVKILKRSGETVKGRLTRRLPSKAGVRTFARVVYRDGKVEPLMTSGSGVLTSTVKANGLVVVPEEKEGFEENEVVDVILIRDLIERTC